jgi:hypothetical protein
MNDQSAYWLAAVIITLALIFACIIVLFLVFGVEFHLYYDWGSPHFAIGAMR